MNDLPRIIPGEIPGYEAVGDNTIMLLSEFSRPITVTCENCDNCLALKLLADEIIPVQQCDEVLDEYLKDIGWCPGPPDRCPSCKDRVS